MRSRNLRVGFIGAGKMSTALARGFVGSGLVKPANLTASDPLPQARTQFAQQTRGRGVRSNCEVLERCTVVFLAVKPQQIEEALQEVRSGLGRRHLLISIAAGMTLRRLESLLPGHARVVRVMPNTPALVGACAAAFARGRRATAADAALTRRLFSAVGFACEVKEPLLDAVTGLSGSGPAFAFLVMEALSDGGVAEGLPREIATTLAAQTVMGAARMVLETGEHPGVLRDMVASPGGTTIEGLHELEKNGVRGALISAVRRAADKSRQLGG